MKAPARNAFTLVEILIVVVILGILAAIVIPQFTSASQEAQVGNVQTQLQTIRGQIELFKVRNNGIPPALVGASGSSFADLLVPPGGELPYIRVRPMNPRNGSDEVVFDNTPIVTAGSGPASAASPGWHYNPATGEFAAGGFDEVPGSPTFNQWVP